MGSEAFAAFLNPGAVGSLRSIMEIQLIVVYIDVDGCKTYYTLLFLLQFCYSCYGFFNIMVAIVVIFTIIIVILMVH